LKYGRSDSRCREERARRKCEEGAVKGERLSYCPLNGFRSTTKLPTRLLPQPRFRRFWRGNLADEYLCGHLNPKTPA
jgi:hypothetical protein